MGFDFKHFSVCDDRCAMKVGTDGVLLGAWCPLDDARSVLDVGAGSGLVSLMLAQRCGPDVKITAVEIDEGAFGDCTANFCNSPWSAMLQAQKSDFKDVNGLFDMIVSNPPFFKDDLRSGDGGRSLARNGLSLNYFSLIEYAASHLVDGGRLVFVSDTRYESDITFHLVLNGLAVTRKAKVRHTSAKPCIRILWEARKGSAVAAPDVTEIVLYDNASRWHDDYVKLTKEFYLHL